MVKQYIKPGWWVTLLGIFFLGVVVQPTGAQNRKAAKQRAATLSYQQAGERDTIHGKEKNRWVDPNATVVRGTPRSQLSSAEQLAYSLRERKVDLQEQIDLLGSELQTARGAQARKITREMELLADQIAVIDRKLEGLPKVGPETGPATSSRVAASQKRDSLGAARTTLQGDGSAAASGNQMGDQRAEKGDPVVYRVQLAAVIRPRAGAFSSLVGVKMVRRPEGLYAYYYGEFANYTDAEDACRRLRTQPQYRDAFVVATQGDRRISLQEAARLLSTTR